jgi:hypothetical protein
VTPLSGEAAALEDDRAREITNQLFEYLKISGGNRFFDAC